MYSGVHIAGLGRGKTMGFPTINLLMKSEEIPYEGVFVVQVFFEESSWFGLLHCGARPTFGMSEVSIEIFLFDFEKDLAYETKVMFDILHFIRPVQTFSSKEALIFQIQQDVLSAKKYIDAIDNAEGQC